MKQLLILLLLVGSSLTVDAKQTPGCTDWVTVPGTNNTQVTRTCWVEEPHPVSPWITTLVPHREYAPANNIPSCTCPD